VAFSSRKKLMHAGEKRKSPGKVREGEARKKSGCRNCPQGAEKMPPEKKSMIIIA